MVTLKYIVFWWIMMDVLAIKYEFWLNISNFFFHLSKCENIVNKVVLLV